MDSRLLVEYSEREPKETNVMLKERLLPLGEAGDKDVFESPPKKNLLLNSSLEISPTTSTGRIKPVSKMTVLNDNVRRVRLPDGRPAPEPHVNHPIQIDIVLIIPVMYLGEILGSLVSAVVMVWTMNSSNTIFGSSTGGRCPDAVGPATYALTALVLLKTVLSSIVCLKLACQAITTEEDIFTEYRVMLRRYILHARTTAKKSVFLMLILSDLLTFATLFICVPLQPAS